MPPNLPHADVRHGDCLDVLRTLPDNSVDAVVTDPPYGLEFMGKEWDAPWKAPRNDLRDSRDPRASADPRFQGQTTDPYKSAVVRYAAGLPFQQWCELWTTECLRVLKPGGYMLAFGGTRTWHRLAVAVEDTGFEIRDSLAWMQGAGFPKSLNVGRAIDSKLCQESGNHVNSSDHVCATTPEGDERRGHGTALKPAFEPIVVARKPLEASTVAGNVLRWGTGALNIDASRIGTSGGGGNGLGSHFDKLGNTTPRVKHGDDEGNTQGRWPANVILDDDQAAVLDQQSGVLAAGNRPRVRNADQNRTAYGDFVGQSNLEHERMDSGGASRFFYCAKAPKSERPAYWRPSCHCETIKPCAETSPSRDTDDSNSVGETSWNTSTCGNNSTALSHPDTTSTTEITTNSTTTSATSNSSPNLNTSASIPDASSATESGGNPAPSATNSSRSPSTTGISVPKAGLSTGAADPAILSEWSETSVCGRCGGRAERVSHATVKPLALMKYLVRLVTPPGGKILEPFAGSGATVEAALLEGFDVVAVEREAEYLPLIRARIDRAYAALAARPVVEPDLFTDEPAQGRWPANVVLDPAMAAALDEQSGNLHGAGAKRDAVRKADKSGMFPLPGDGNRFGDSGGASRFFKIADPDEDVA